MIISKLISFNTTLKSSAVLLLDFSQKAAPYLLDHQGPAAPRNRDKWKGEFSRRISAAFGFVKSPTAARDLTVVVVCDGYLGAPKGSRQLT